MANVQRVAKGELAAVATIESILTGSLKDGPYAWSVCRYGGREGDDGKEGLNLAQCGPLGSFKPGGFMRC